MIPYCLFSMCDPSLLFNVSGDELLPFLGDGAVLQPSRRIKSLLVQHLLFPQAARWRRRRRRTDWRTRCSKALDQSCWSLPLWSYSCSSASGRPLGIGCESERWEQWLYMFIISSQVSFLHNLVILVQYLKKKKRTNDLAVLTFDVDRNRENV